MKVTGLSLGHLDSTSADPPSQRRKTQAFNGLRWCSDSAHVTQEKYPNASAIALFPQSPKLRGSPASFLLQSGTFPFTSVLPCHMWGNSALFNLPLRCPSFKGKTGKMHEGH